MAKKTASPCGKCTACDCGPNGTCNSSTAKKANQSGPKTPTVNCECAKNRVRKAPTPTGPLADSYTCHRPKIVETAPVMETRCTCRNKEQTKVECACSPPQAPQAVTTKPSQANSFAPQPTPQPETVHITCGHSGPGASRPHYEKPAASGGCAHCKTKSSKKCVIQ